MKWRIVKPERHVPRYTMIDWPIVERSSYMAGEIVETVVRKADGTFWQFTDWAYDERAYQVMEEVQNEVEGG